MTLLRRDDQAPPSWRGDLPVTSRYTFGVAGERFFRALKEKGTIMGTICPRCDHTYVPAALFCERCFAELTEWVDVGRVGTLHTFTLLFEDERGDALDEPRLVGLVALGDGGIVHDLAADPEELEIGMAMEAVLLPKNRRTGALSDIRHFRPVQE